MERGSRGTVDSVLAHKVLTSTQLRDGQTRLTETVSSVVLADVWAARPSPLSPVDVLVIGAEGSE